MIRYYFLAIAVFFLGIQTTQATVVHDESVDGDLSGVFASPTLLSTTNGPNTVVAQFGNNGNSGATDGTDADYFAIVIPSGGSLTSISVDSFTFSPGNPGSSLFAYVSGTAFTGQGTGDIDAFDLFNAGAGNLIPGDLPLGPGAYSFWLQETSDNVVNVQLTFNQVPEPATFFLAMIGAWTGITGRSRRGHFG